MCRKSKRESIPFVSRTGNFPIFSHHASMEILGHYDASVPSSNRRRTGTRAWNSWHNSRVQRSRHLREFDGADSMELVFEIAPFPVASPVDSTPYLTSYCGGKLNQPPSSAIQRPPFCYESQFLRSRIRPEILWIITLIKSCQGSSKETIETRLYRYDPSVSRLR